MGKMITEIRDRKIDTILVDFDGTVMDTNELILNSWLYAIKKFTGRDASVDEIESTFGEVIKHTMARLVPNVGIEESLKAYREYQVDNYLKTIHPFEGVKETLETLRNEGFHVAMVTSRMPKSTKDGLEHYGLYDYFETIITPDSCPEFKPHPRPILLAMEELGSVAEHTIMVGDTKHDMEAANAAGVVAVLVDYSIALPPGKRDGVSPDYIIDKFSDILTLVGIGKN